MPSSVPKLGQHFIALVDIFMKTETRLHFLSEIFPLEKLISACAHTGDAGAKTQTDLHTLSLPGWKDEYPFENLEHPVPLSLQQMARF